MATERAIVKGLVLDAVNTRMIFTCDVVPSGGDTQALLWDTYLDSVYVAVGSLLGSFATTSTAELQGYSAGHWIPFDEIAFVHAGSNNGTGLVNAAAFVILGKAAGLRHVGRKFFSGLTENTAEGNGIYAALASVAAATLLAYITPFTGIGGGTITPGVVDKNGTFHAFVGGMVSSLLGSMRRRKPGVGI